MSYFAWVAVTAVISWVCFILGSGRKENQMNEATKQLKEREAAKLLGPHAPEGGQTVIERLRQAGFTVLDKLTPPRAHMLGWLQVTPTPSDYTFICIYCKGRLHEIYEVAEDPGQPFRGALMVFTNFICRICNSCAVILGDAKFGDKRVGLRKLFDKADRNNLFEILDHMQGQSGTIDEKMATWLQNRKQLLEREAAKIGDVLIHHEIGEAEEAGDGPYRDMTLPERENVPSLLKKKE